MGDHGNTMKVIATSFYSPRLEQYNFQKCTVGSAATLYNDSNTNGVYMNINIEPNDDLEWEEHVQNTNQAIIDPKNNHTDIIDLQTEITKLKTKITPEIYNITKKHVEEIPTKYLLFIVNLTNGILSIKHFPPRW